MMNVLKKVAICAVCVLVIFGIFFAGALGSTYTRQARVVHVWGDEVEVEDEQGNLWAFYGDDYKVGQTVKLIMSDCETVGITDDVILDVK